MSDEEDREETADRGLRAYEIDADTVRVNNPNQNEPDAIVRRLASGEVRTYPARKKKE